MIHGDGDATDKEKWSEGYYVGYTYATGLELTFEFNSDIATTATLTLLLGSELGDLTLVPEKFGIRVNGEEQTYTSFSVYGSADMEAAEFDKCVLPSPINLVAGKNTVTLVIYENDYKSGATGGPMIDYIEVKSANANLTWTPKTDNPSKRGEI